MVKLPSRSKQDFSVSGGSSISICFHSKWLLQYSTLLPENSKKVLGKMVLAERCELIRDWVNELNRTFASNGRMIIRCKCLKISILFLRKEACLSPRGEIFT